MSAFFLLMWWHSSLLAFWSKNPQTKTHCLRFFVFFRFSFYSRILEAIINMCGWLVSITFRVLVSLLLFDYVEFWFLFTHLLFGVFLLLEFLPFYRFLQRDLIFAELGIWRMNNLLNCFRNVSRHLSFLKQIDLHFGNLTIYWLGTLKLTKNRVEFLFKVFKVIYNSKEIALNWILKKFKCIFPDTL